MIYEIMLFYYKLYYMEAKENLEIQHESQTLASVTFQNYFRMYNKLSGMTGTAATEAEEFRDIYRLNVVKIPTNVPVKRIDVDDEIYGTEKEKFILHDLRNNVIFLMESKSLLKTR